MEDPYVYYTGREMVPPFSYRIDNQLQIIPGSNRIIDMEDLWKIYLPGEKKTGQVIKDVTTVYLPDSGVKHKPGILKGMCKAHTCLPLPQMFWCKLWIVQMIIIKKIISVIINNFCYCQENTVLQRNFSSICVTGTKAQTRQIWVEIYVNGVTPLTAGKRRKHPFPNPFVEHKETKAFRSFLALR